MEKIQKPKSQWKRQKQQLQKKKESGLRQKYLPVDVIHEILVRSPVKTLGKFRCVCKQWGSIISQPSFQEDHHGRCYPANPLVLLTRCEFNGVDVSETNTLHFSTYTSEGTLVKTFSKTVAYQSNYIPMQSCLGLVCLGSKFSWYPILICNPSTEELITLPRTQQMHICIGFGYATFTKQFKVVRFFKRPVFNETQICCEVFTLGTSGWKEARNPPQNPQNLRLDAPFLHGALHLLPYFRSKNEGARISIDAFDIETETYTKIPLPEYFDTVKSSLLMMYLKEFGGSLCLAYRCLWVLEFWCLNYYNREWVKKYSVSLDSLCDNPWQADPLKIMPDGNMMLSLEGEDEDDALYYYNFRDKTFTKDTTMNTWGTLYVESSLRLASR